MWLLPGQLFGVWDKLWDAKLHKFMFVRTKKHGFHGILSALLKRALACEQNYVCSRFCMCVANRERENRGQHINGRVPFGFPLSFEIFLKGRFQNRTSTQA